MKTEQNKTVLYREPQKGAAHICVVDGSGAVRTYPVSTGLTIGRAGSGRNADCLIDCVWISGLHGRIYQAGTEYVYEDLDSTNGTYINDKQYGAGGERGRMLRHGDVIRIGNVKNITPGKEPAIILFRRDDCSSESWQRILPDEKQGEICLGRSNVEPQDLQVSRKHAAFFLVNDRWAVKDFGSLNGVFLNNRRIGKPQYLYYGDCVRLAEHYFIYMGRSLLFNVKDQWKNSFDPAAAKSKAQAVGPSLCIYIEERTVFQRFKKLTLLKDIHMTIENGEMVLILGGSGAGKTTFMNAVMGYEKARGTIRHGDRDLYEDYEAVKYNIGFVPQQDLIRFADTVENTLNNAAVMKMPAGTSFDSRSRRVDQVMEMLGLTRERKAQVQKLSGGQKKRLSIAVELISNPGLFFLDEPDSGLDGIMARSLMENLRTIADQGKIVMVITHGPDRAADLFDKVVVLAKSEKDNVGHLAFFGPVQEAYKFFNCQSLEGVVRRINRKDEGGDGMGDFYIEKYARMSSE